MSDHEHVEISQQDLKDAQAMWHNFVTAGKYAVIVSCITLIGLALAFVDLF